MKFFKVFVLTTFIVIRINAAEKATTVFYNGNDCIEPDCKYNILYNDDMQTEHNIYKSTPCSENTVEAMQSFCAIVSFLPTAQIRFERWHVGYVATGMWTQCSALKDYNSSLNALYDVIAITILISLCIACSCALTHCADAKIKAKKSEIIEAIVKYDAEQNNQGNASGEEQQNGQNGRHI